MQNKYIHVWFVQRLRGHLLGSRVGPVFGWRPGPDTVGLGVFHNDDKTTKMIPRHKHNSTRPPRADLKPEGISFSLNLCTEAPSGQESFSHGLASDGKL